MKKRIWAVLSAVMVLAIGSMSVSAASPTAGTTEKPAEGQKAVTSVASTADPKEYASKTSSSDGYEVEEVSESTVKSAAVAVQNELLNKLSSIGSALKSSALSDAASDPSKKVTASILSVVEVNPTSAKKDEDGNYVVTLNMKGVQADDTIAVLHYDGSEWELIAPEKVEKGAVTFVTESLSPISIVKLEVEDVMSSPQTGETMPAAVCILLAGIAGAVFCGKKYFA